MPMEPDDESITSPGLLCHSFDRSLKKLRSLDKLNDDSSEDLADIQTYISVLITILQKASECDNYAGLGNAVRSCTRPLNLLDEFIKTYDPAETGTTEVSEQSTPSEQYKKSLAQSRNALVNACNTLRLTMAFGCR